MGEMANSTIRLKLLDEEVEVPYEELEVSASPYSGRPLKKIEINLNVPAARSTEVREALNKAHDPELAFHVDGIHWAVSSSSCSYREGSEVHEYRVELEEVEVPQAERVEMLGLSLIPLRYKEKVFDDGVLMVSLLVALNEGEDKILEAAIREARPEGEYFDAVRVGVSDISLRVRFGRCLWEQSDDRRLHLLRLVADEDEPVDGGIFSRQHQPELERAQEKIAALEDKVDLLIRHLAEAETLDRGAEARLQKGAPDSWSRHFRDFDQTTEIEDFF